MPFGQFSGERESSLRRILANLNYKETYSGGKANRDIPAGGTRIL